MEMRAGYKQTEVGVIPEDWEASTIGSNSGWMSGGTPSRSNAEYWSGTVPWISGSTLKSVEISTSDQSLTPQAVAAGSKMAPLGSTLLLVRGSALHNEIRAGLAVAPVAFNQDVKALVPSARVEAKFLTYYILAHADQLLKLVSSAGNSAGVLDTELVQNFKFLKPQVPEQRAIAKALSDVDALLAKIDQLIAKKRDLKQAAMQQLLTGQTRLPGFSGEWEVKPMKSLGQTYGGLAGKTKEDFGHGTSKYIPFMNVMTDTVIDSNWLETVDVAHTETQNLAKKGDLFFNGSSETPEEVGFCSVLLDDIPHLYLNSFCFGFRFNADAMVCGLFFAYWFRGADGRAAMSVLAQGATRYNIAKSAFMRLSIPQPSPEEQTAIATVLSDMDAELATLEARRDKTRALKQGMMQALLTGRIRLAGVH
jgi:type I restriction enzyme S subunit